jgi:diguanylate cyclase (GGDEF)-like protein
VNERVFIKRIQWRFGALLCAATMCVPGFFALGVRADEKHLSFPGNSRFAVQRLADEFGLSAVTVTAVGQDAQGFLWICTQTGLYRYDGASAKKMTEVESIVGHYVVDMLIAPDGTPWFAGNHGVAHYKNGQFETLAIPNAAMPLGTGNQIFAVDGKGAVYVLLFNRGVLRVDPEHGNNSKILGEADGIEGSAAGLVRAADDAIWLTFGTHLARIAPDTLQVELDRDIRVPKERIVALIFDGTQNLWLRTNAHLLRLDTDTHTATDETKQIGPANEEEGKPTLDQSGRLLVPSATGLHWQQQNGTWRVITDKQGISSNDIQSAIEDREGTLWVAGSGTGLDRVPGVHEWSAWTTGEGLPDNSTWATVRDPSGRLWVSTVKGIGVWDESKHRWEKISALEEQGKRGIRQIQLAGDGSVWALTPIGALIRIDGRNFSITSYGIYHGEAYQTILAAPDGKIWATTHSHMVYFDPKKPETNPIAVRVPDNETGDILYLSFAPNGVLWAAGPGTLHRYDGETWKTLTSQDGLQGQTITSLVALNENDVWIAYNDVVKVTHVRLTENGAARMEHYNWDWTILGCDSAKRIWFNGTDGIAIRYPDGHIQRLSHADGLIWDDISPWTGVREETDGSFVIATSRGMARYRPVQPEKVALAPRAVLTSITLGGVERRASDKPEVASADGSLAVEFTPLILGNPGNVSCWYQLKGLEKRATETKLREVRYGGLPAGKYDFQVKCQTADRLLVSPAASFRFDVLPSFWQTSWARILGGILLLGCFWGFVWLRTSTLSRRRRELEFAVAQRSAELLQKNRELEEISLTDPLTGTRNRRYFYETISTDIAQALRSHLKTADASGLAGPRQELIFVLVDIDRFKRVNDELGHAAGDHLLQEVAKRIAGVMRRSDDLVRWGGEEFLLVCRTTDRENASLLCARVLEAVRELPFDVGNGVEVHKTCSIGWAPFPWLQDDVGLLSIDNVIELADKALYLAKREGRNRSFGMLPSPEAQKSERAVSIEILRDCPPDLVQIV